MIKKLTYYSFLYTIFSFIVKLISFLCILFLGKVLTPDNYAYFALLFSLHQGIASFGAAGIKESIIGHLKKFNKNRDELYSNGIISAIPSFLLITLSSLFIYEFYLKIKNPNLIFFCFVFTVISGIILSYSSLKSHLYRLNENHFLSMLYLFLPQIILFASGITFFQIFNNPQYFFLGSSILLFFSIFSFKIFLDKSSWKWRYGSYTSKIFRESIPYFIIAFAGWLKGYGNNFLINIFLDSYAIASFSFLFTFSGIILMIADSVNSVWAPRVYNSYSTASIEKIESSNNLFYGTLAFFIGIVVSLIILLYPIILELIGGNLVLYSQLRLELYLILASYILYTPIWHYRIYYYINSEGKRLMNITILSSVIGIVSMIMFIKYFGSLGIYLGFLSFTIINLLAILLLSPRDWKLNINWSGVMAGLIISLISYYLLINQYNVSTILFLVVCLIISTPFLNKIKRLNL